MLRPLCASKASYRFFGQQMFKNTTLTYPTKGKNVAFADGPAGHQPNIKAPNQIGDRSFSLI